MCAKTKHCNQTLTKADLVSDKKNTCEQLHIEAPCCKDINKFYALQIKTALA